MRYYVLLDTKQPKFKWPERSKTYPSGDPIPASLPNSYQLHQDCISCAAYNAKTTMCSTYNAPVLSTYWCHTWKAKS